MQAGGDGAEPQCYQGLNEPVEAPLSFAFGARGWSGWEFLVPEEVVPACLSAVRCGRVELVVGSAAIRGAEAVFLGRRESRGKRVARTPRTFSSGRGVRFWVGAFMGHAPGARAQAGR